jgi:hypothetical protein
MKQLYKKHKQLLPLILLSLFSLWTSITFITGNAGDGVSLSNQHYYAFIAIALNFLAYFFFRKAYKYVLIAVLVLGLFNVLNFTGAEITTTFSLNSFHISVQPVSFFAGLFTLAINLDKAGDFLSVSENNNTK